MEKITRISIGAIVLMSILGYFFLAPDRNQSVIKDIPVRESTTSAIKIIAFGDSLTAGYGLPVSEGYPAQLEASLRKQGKSVSVINAGVSGETSRGNLERAPFIRSQNPDIVLLGIGGNDALRALPIADTIQNLTETVTILKGGENPPIVILLQMQSPLNAGFAYKRDFDNMYEQIAAEHNLVLVPFITTEIFLKPENLLADRIHLNKTGYATVVDSYLLGPVMDVIEKIDG